MLVAAGGATGSALRYVASGFAQRHFAAGTNLLGMPALPTGTMLVNLTGSFLIGMLAGLVEARGMPGPGMRLLLVTGVLGGYTTFSALSLETLLLLRGGQSGTALISVAAQLVVGVAAAWAGFAGAVAFGRAG